LINLILHFIQNKT